MQSCFFKIFGLVRLGEKAGMLTLEIRNLLLSSYKDRVMQLNKFSTDNECVANRN